eukprot:2317300-Pyramimonas_sp.AAC.1
MRRNVSAETGWISAAPVTQKKQPSTSPRVSARRRSQLRSNFVGHSGPEAWISGAQTSRPSPNG